MDDEIDLVPVTVAFPLVDDPKTSLLAWTTTPWTLPSNLGLCVHPDYTYLKIHDTERDQNFIIHEKLLRTLFKDPKKAKYKKIRRETEKNQDESAHTKSCIECADIRHRTASHTVGTKTSEVIGRVWRQIGSLYTV